MQSKLKILIIIFLLIFSQYMYAAFNNDTVSANSAALGNAFTAVDATSGIFYNPAVTGVVASDSFFKSDLLYENKYGISGYDYYSGAVVLSGVSLLNLIKFGVSGYYENADSIMAEKNIKLSIGTTLLSTFKRIYLSTGISLGYYNISFSGFQEDDNDTALADNNYFDVDAGVYIVYDDLRLGIVSANLINSDLRNNKLPIRIGMVYDMSKYASLISMDFEMVKDINGYNRSWLKIGSFELGKNIYPLFKFGFEKTVKNILTLRIGLRDFKFTGGLGIAIRGFQLNYAFINNNIGITHLIGVSIKSL